MSVFSFALSNSGLFGSISITMSYPLYAAGPAGVVWCWLIGSIGCLCIAWSVAELISCFPTSGGMYYTLAHLVPKKYKAVACWIDGWLYLLGSITSTCSGDIACAQMICAVISMATDFQWAASGSHMTGIAIAVMVSHGLFNSLPPKIMSGVTKYYCVINIGTTFAAIIHLLVKCKNINSASYVFTTVIPNTGWSDPGWSFLFGFLSVSWVMTSYDASARISEETANASYKTPLAIASALTLTAFLGWVLVIVFTLVMGKDNLDQLLFENPTGQPIVMIFYNVLGKQVAIVYLSLAILIIWFGGCVGVCSLSRTYWSFARDKGLPYPEFWLKLNKYTGTPIRCVWLVTFHNCLLALINMGSEVAMQAIFSACAISTDWSYVVCIGAYMINRKRFGIKRGPFNMGKLTTVINLIACIWTIFVSIIFIFPNYIPVTAADMNYTIVLLTFTFIGAGGWWLLGANKFYTGPRSNLTD